MDALLVLVLFGVFAVCILLVLLTGADAYRRLAGRDQRSYDRRTVEQYLTTRVRQADRLGGVAVERFGETDALVLYEQIDGEEYRTLVYCHEGWLRELFALAEGDFAPEDGEKVLQARGLSLGQQGRLLTAELTDPAGETQRVTLYLRSGEGAAP